MGKLISLSERLAERSSERGITARGRAAFFFALDCPLSYLVAERMERDFGQIAWVPMLSPSDPRRARERFFRTLSIAAGAGMPLIEPENFPFDPKPVTRGAVFAAAQGAGAGFAVAAMRLTFAGGFDLSDPDVIAEAAAAAGLSAEEVLTASQDPGNDTALASVGRGLVRRGVAEAPVMRIDGGWFSGLDALAQTTEFTAARASYHAQLNNLA
ncbi:MAG: DsbA family protein [Solirubrobacterales bacterium]|nr:DsbA family protein [Solirubrobacterales bacterium]